MRSCDLFEVAGKSSSNAAEFLAAAWADYPQKDYLCIINVYKREDSKWKLLSFSNFKDISSSTSVHQLYDAFKALNAKYKIWVLSSKDGLQGSTFDDIEWDANACCSMMATLFDDNFVSRHVKCFEDRTLADAPKLTTRKDVVLWYQFASTDYAPIKALVEKMAKPASKQSETTSGSYFKQWQSVSGNSMNDVIDSISKKLDSRVSEVFGDYDVLCQDVADFIDSFDDPEDAAYELFDEFNLGRLVDRESWWDLIPD